MPDNIWRDDIGTNQLSRIFTFFTHLNMIVDTGTGGVVGGGCQVRSQLSLRGQLRGRAATALTDRQTDWFLMIWKRGHHLISLYCVAPAADTFLQSHDKLLRSGSSRVAVFLSRASFESLPRFLALARSC